jgi:tRNA pseudouridine55 synthase
VDGFLYVDKPAGITSHDVVAVVRRSARSKRVGHAGTLDPFATGLLVIAVGQCTRLLPYVSGEPKVYEACIRFGVETETDDGTGQPTRHVASPDLGDAVRLSDAIASLTGALQQRPPAYSAKHVDGVRAYTLARRGADVVLPPVAVQVHEWQVRAVEPDRLHVTITCGGGTYIRALARDLGLALGSGAHCESLRRIASGSAHVQQAVPLDALTPGAVADATVPLRPSVEVVDADTHQALDSDGLRDLSFGRAVPATQPGALAALLYEGDVVAMARRTAHDMWQPKVVLLGEHVT